MAKMLDPSKQTWHELQEPLQFLTAKVYELRDKTAKGIVSASSGDGISLNGTTGYVIESNFIVQPSTISPITVEGNISSSGFILAKTPMIQLNSTDNSTNAYQAYTGASDDPQFEGGWQITFDKEEIKDSDFFTHNTSTNSERITVIYDGRYEVSYVVAVNGNSSGDARAMPTVKVFKNGSWERNFYLNNTGYLRRSGGINNVTVSGQYIIECDAGDYISLATGFQTGFGAAEGTAIELSRYGAQSGYTKVTIQKVG